MLGSSCHLDWGSPPRLGALCQPWGPPQNSLFLGASSAPALAPGSGSWRSPPPWLRIPPLSQGATNAHSLGDRVTCPKSLFVSTGSVAPEPNLGVPHMIPSSSPSTHIPKAMPSRGHTASPSWPCLVPSPCTTTLAPLPPSLSVTPSTGPQSQHPTYLLRSIEPRSITTWSFDWLAVFVSVPAAS